MPKRFVFTMSALLALGSAHAKADPVSFGPSLASTGWKPLNFRGLKPVDFRAEGANRLTIRADGAASVIWRELDENFWPKTQAKWRWKVDQTVPATNLAVKGSDDRAIALYFVFAKDEASARSGKGATSFTSAMWRSSGTALVYVWGGSGTRGQVIASPHLGSSGKLVLRQPGGITNAAFQPEMANLATDFRRAFGRDPGPLVGVAVSSDSDDTKGLNVGMIEALSVD
jgi:Protein of unknown function (DUF3047)